MLLVHVFVDACYLIVAGLFVLCHYWRSVGPVVRVGMTNLILLLLVVE